MALNMSSATNARSRAGLAKLKNDFNTDLNKVISKLSGSKYDEMVRTIRANWEGADAEDFLKDIEKTKDALKKQVRALRHEIERTLDNDYNDFVKFQQRNVR